MQHVGRAQTESWTCYLDFWDFILPEIYQTFQVSNKHFQQIFKTFFYIYIYLFIYLSDEHTAQHSVCENLHSLEVYRQCQIDDVQTAAERAVRGFYKELRG